MYGQQNIKKSRENLLGPKAVPLFIDGDSSLTYLPRGGRWGRIGPSATQNIKSFTHLIKQKIIRVKPITKGTAFIIIVIFINITIIMKVTIQPNNRTGSLKTTLATQWGDARLGCMEHNL